MRDSKSLSSNIDPPHSKGENPTVVQGRFTDFDEFTESTAEWDIDFRQVGKGSLSATLLQLLDPQISIAKARFDRGCLQTGASPAAMQTFAILSNSAPDTRFCGTSLTANSIGLFPNQGEFSSMSPPGFNVFTLSVEENWLAELAEKTLDRSSHEFLPDAAAVMPFSTASLHPIRSQLQQLERMFMESKSDSKQVQALRIAKQDIAISLLNLLASRQVSDWNCARSRRHALLRTAREYISEHLAEPVRVMHVAVALGVTVRTLETVFKELLDVTPQVYIMTARLYRVHRALKRGDPESTVGGIARELGFWHMGQFARDYRARFNELPSATLAGR